MSARILKVNMPDGYTVIVEERDTDSPILDYTFGCNIQGAGSITVATLYSGNTPSWHITAGIQQQLCFSSLKEAHAEALRQMDHKYKKHTHDEALRMEQEAKRRELESDINTEVDELFSTGTN